MAAIHNIGDGFVMDYTRKRGTAIRVGRRQCHSCRVGRGARISGDRIGVATPLRFLFPDKVAALIEEPLVKHHVLATAAAV
jgi:hypothetical protein